MRWRATAAAYALAAGLLPPGPPHALAQPAGPPGSPASVASPEWSATDLRFAQEAARTGAYQVEAARIAEQRALHPKVKAFAVALARDHAAADEELKALALSHGQDLPTDVSPMRRKQLDGLGELAGEAFDLRYVQQVAIADQEAAVLLFESASSAADPGLRAWAAKVLPMLRAHLAAARELPLMAQPRPVA